MFKHLKEKAKHLLAGILSLTTFGSGLAALMTTVSADSEWELEENDNLLKVAYHDTSGGEHGFNYIGNGKMVMRNKVTGEEIEVFCAQKEISTSKSDRTYGTETEIENLIQGWDNTTRNKIALVGAWYYIYSGKSAHEYTAAQWYVWTLTQSAKYGRAITLDRATMQAQQTSHGYNMSDLTKVLGYFDDIGAFITKYGNNDGVVMEPQGDGLSYENGQLKVTPGDTITLKDKSGVYSWDEWQLSNADALEAAGITVDNSRKSENILILHVSESFVGNSTINLEFKRKFDFSGDDRYIVFAANGTNDRGQQGQATIYPHHIFGDPSGSFGFKASSGRIFVDKKDSITHESLAGATFEIHKDSPSGEVVGTLRTNSSGHAESEYLPDGTYYVVETGVPTGYNKGIFQGGVLTGDVKNVTLSGNDVTVTFEDKIIQGKVKIRKVDEEHPNYGLEGVKFDIYMTANKNGNLSVPVKVGSLTTGDDGYVESGLLDYGSYYLIETNTIYGFFNGKTRFDFDIHQEGIVVEQTLTNKQTQLRIDVLKEDSNKDGYFKEGENKGLAGAKFKLYEHVVLRDVSGFIQDEYDTEITRAGIAVSDANGHAIFENPQISFSNTLQQTGSYYFIKEIEAPVGYYLNDDIFKVEFVYPGQDTLVAVQEPKVQNDVMTNEIKIYKIDSETGLPLAGAKFTIENDKGDIVDTVTSGPDGYATSKDVRPGHYFVTEIEAPENYDVDIDVEEVIQEVVVDEETGEVTVVQQNIPQFEDAPKKGTLKLTKVDGATLKYSTVCEDEEDPSTCEEIVETDDDTLYLGGAKFFVYAADDLSTVIEEVETDAEGKLELRLFPGEYLLQEYVAPKGYNVNHELIPVTIIADEDSNVMFSNQVIYGNVSVYKIGEELVGTEEKEDGSTGLVWEDRFQPNTKFELTADGEIKNPVNGKVLYEDGETVREVITDEEGVASIKDLSLGNYCLREVIAPEEHSLSDEYEQCFNITEEESDFEGVVEKEVTFRNERIIIDPTLYKQAGDLVDITDASQGYTYRSLAGAVFGVYNADVIKSNDEKVEVPADTLLATMTTKEDGTADVEVKLPFGKYYVKEIEAPSGYILNEEVFPFELVWSQELQEEKVLHVKISDEETPIVNFQHEVPKTGIVVTTGLIAGVAAVTVAGLVLVIARKRKDNLAD